MVIDEGSKVLTLGPESFFENGSTITGNETPTITSLFENSVSTNPNAISLISPSENIFLTYSKLNLISNRIALELFARLGDNLIKNQEIPIGICLPRSASLVISTLGVLKSGHPYLPLDPNAPIGQVLFMLEKSKSIAVIAPSKFQRRLSAFRGIFIPIESLQENIGQNYKAFEKVKLTPENLAYIMFTSGSTGQPKGVQIEHSSLANRLSITHLSPNKSDSVLFLSSPTFDNSVFEIFSALTSGAKLVIAPPFIELDISALLQLITQEEITVLQVVPSLLNEMVRSPLAATALKTVRLLITGGEPLTNSLCQKTLETLPETSDFYNIYGVTEATIDSTCWKCIPSSSQEVIPIGKPLNDTIQMYILDSELQPTSDIGELYIGGTGLARGYIDNVNHQFIKGPFSSGEIKSPRLYRTGDLARFLPDGNIEFFGRNDYQVKVNGIRVELGQIESAITKQEGINQAVVILTKPSKSSLKPVLVAYVKFTNGNNQDISEVISNLEENLKQEISEKIIPSIFIPVIEFPLTPSGKLDRLALQERDVQIKLQPYEAPKTEIETILCRVAQEVLMVKGFGRNDNFFRLGGDSITAMQFCSIVAKEHGIEIKVMDIFQAPTVTQLAKRCGPFLSSRQNGLEATNGTSSIDEDITENSQPLTPLQSGLLFNAIYKEKRDEYIIRTLFHIKGPLDIEVFKHAWALAIQKYPALRTSFVWEGKDKPVKVVNEPDAPLINCKNWKIINSPKMPLVSPKTKSDIVESILSHPETRDSIDLATAVLMTWHIFKTESSYLFLWQAHHILLDGWSISIVLSDVFNIYCKLSTSSKFSLDLYPVISPFYPCPERRSSDLIDVHAFWEEYLSDMEPQTLLPIINVKESQTTKNILENVSPHQVMEVDLEPSISSKLKLLSRECEVTLNTVFQGAWTLLLSRYLGQRDILFGTTVSTRSSTFDSTVGLLINTLPFRMKVDEEYGLERFLQEVQTNASSLMQVSEQTELYKIKELKKRPGLMYFDTLFVFENYPDSFACQKQIGNLTIEEIKVWDATGFPLTVAIVPPNLEGCIQLAFSFNIEVISSKVMYRLVTHFKTLLTSMVMSETSQSKKISNLEILPEGELRDILEIRQQDNHEDQEVIFNLIDSIAERHPKNIAISNHDGRQLTYQKLSAASSQCANYLSQFKKVEAEEIIAICGDKSPQLFISILGVMKSGAAFLPLDPSNPENRLDFMLANSQAKILIVDQKYIDKFKLTPESNIEILILDDLEKTLEEEQIDPLIKSKVVNPNSLAYLMYTSGTTGLPKGVQIEHKGITNLVKHFGSTFNISPDSRILQFASIGFDAFVSEWATAFANGATLSLPKPGKKEILGENLINILIDEKITWVTLPPSTLATIPEDVTLPSLKTIIVAGETGDVKHFQRWTAIGKEVYNAYGPTEGTVCATMKRFEREVSTWNIGCAISNTKIYILDSLQRPAPYGTVGEIYIAGVGVARGYQNACGQDDKFFPNLWSHNVPEAFSRVYKTGDLGRLLPSGDIEIIGRSDEQVKIRGFRIELKEIESVILNQFQDVIAETCVIQREDHPGKKQLVAYLRLSRKNRTAGEAEAKLPLNFVQTLSKFLLDCMVPKFFVILPQIPLTINGKIDKSALRIPTEIDRRLVTGLESEFTDPRNDIEKSLCQIWSELLNVSQVGIHDNFFQIGGDSILCIFMRNQAQKLGYQMSVKDIFENPTISQLAFIIQISKVGNNNNAQLSLYESQAQKTLSPIQQWFFELNLENVNHWNQSILLRPYEPMDEILLEKAIHSLVKHHDVLRVIFKLKSNSVDLPLQHTEVTHLQLNNIISHVFKIVNLSSKSSNEDSLEEMSQEINKVQSSFDITKGPLFSSVLFKLPQNEQRLFLCAHHTVVDSVSWKILVEDLVQSYDALTKSKSTEGVLIKTTSYGQWVEKQNEMASKHDFTKDDLEYWKKEMTLVNSIEMTLRTSGGPDTICNDVLKLTFSESFTTQLLHGANRPYRTQTNELLLTAWAQTVDEVFHYNLYIAIEGHGREESILDNETQSNVDLSRTVGWFTSIFPVVIQLEDFSDVGRSIATTKDKLRLVPHHGASFGPLCYFSQENFKVPQGPKMSFNYTGGLDPSFKYFELAPEDISDSDISKENHLPFPLALDIEIRHKCLEVLITFDAHKFPKDLVKNLSEAFEIKLSNLVEYCLAQKSKIFWTLSDFPLLSTGLKPVLSDQTQLALIWNNTPCSKDIIDMYPLAPTQSDILMSCLLQENNNDAFKSDVYITQTVMEIQGNFSLEKFKQAWQLALDEFDVLRTGFVTLGLEEPIQFVLKPGSVTIPWETYQLDCTTEFVSTELDKILSKDKMNLFSFRKPPLMRASMVNESQNRKYFIWTFHHILLDGWSASIALKRVNQLYNQLLYKDLNTQIVSPIRQPFKKFVNHISSKVRKNNNSEEFWLTYLKDTECSKFLEIKHSRKSYPDEPTHLQKSLKFTSEETQDLIKFAQENSLTLNTVLQAAWAIILHFYSSKTDIVFGVVTSGRQSSTQFDDTVGLLISTVPFRIKIEADGKVINLLNSVQTSMGLIQDQGPIPLSKIKGALNNQGNGSALFDTLFVFENYPDESNELEIANGEGKMTVVKVNEGTEFPLTLTIVLNQNEILCEFTASESDFDAKILERLTGHFKTVCNGISNQQISISSIPWITSEEQKELDKWNDTSVEDWDLENLSISQMFEKQVELHGEAVAIQLEDKFLTYCQLNYLANRWAHFLRSEGLQRDTLVAVCLERSIDLIATLLGIIKAGGAYVPLDSSYPPHRVAQMISDCQPLILITDQKLNNKFFQSYSNQKVLLEQVSKQLDKFPIENLAFKPNGNNLAYVMYTSGSTGTPKGVAMEHACITNLFKSTQITSPISQGDKMLVKISLSFDVSVSEIFWPLATGAQLVLLPPTTENDINLMAKCIEENGVTIIRMVPSVLNAMLLLDDFSYTCRSLRIIICSGEPLTQSTFFKTMSLLPNLTLLSNKYGPTETHEITTWEGTREEFLQNSSPTIGIPLHNCKILILNEYLQSVPVGILGEIYIAGVCLARGYLNRPEITAEKFILNPFSNSTNSNSRLYKTGDLGRFLENGQIEYLGRIDHQVKIRGYRIELEEVEKILMSTNPPLVDQSLVCCISNNLEENILAAYVTPVNINISKKDLAEKLRNHLKQRLPKYMVPSIIIVLDKFPLTSNGKIDRKILPKTMVHDNELEKYKNEKMSKTEIRLASIWQRALGIGQEVRRCDNFFYLGGHSLVAMKVNYFIRKEFGVDVTLRSIFDRPVLAELAEEIETVRLLQDSHIYQRDNKNSSNILETQPIHAKLELTPQQHSLWVLSKLLPSDKPVYTIPILLKFTGVLDIPKLENAMNLLSLRHPSLRTIFPEIDGQPIQQILNESHYDFKFTDLSHYNEAEMQLGIQNMVALPFDLQKGPLFRCFVIKQSSTIYQVLLTCHHIILDDESCNVLLSNLLRFYINPEFLNGKPVTVPSKIHLKSHPDMEKQLEYWKEELSSLSDQMISLPYDHPRPSTLTYEGRSHSFSIPDEMTEKLMRLSCSQKVTLFQTYLAAFQVFLHKYASSPEVVLVGLPISNREGMNEEIGFFVNTIVSKATFSNDKSQPTTFIQFLEKVRNNTLNAFKNQNVPFDLLCKTLSTQRSPNSNPFFQVMFSFTANSSEGENHFNKFLTPELKIEIQNLESQVSKFDLTLSAHVEDNKFTSFCFEYSTDLFKTETITRMSLHFVNILNQISLIEDTNANRDLTLDNLSLLTETEINQMKRLHQGKQTIKVDLKDKFVSIIDMLKFQAESNPNAIAVNKMTYLQLHKKVHQFALYLIKDLKLRKNSKVAFCMDRSEQLVIKIMGTLKAGCIYVPIDPSLPEKRIQSILKDCQPSVLFVKDINNQCLENTRVISLNDESTKNIFQNGYSQVQIQIQPDDLAYITYTSGSTGQPKGIANTHLALSNWVESVKERIPLFPGEDTVLFTTCVGFDVSISEIIWPLTQGARLVVSPPNLQQDLLNLARFIEAEKVTVIRGVPTMLSLLTHPDASLLHLSHSPLKMAISAGEALPHESASKILEVLPHLALYNMYGATETCIDATIWKVDLEYGKVIVGEPFNNVNLYVIDPNTMTPVPPGVKGEICVSGACLAKGYINLPDETSRRFVGNSIYPDGACDELHSVVYKTGDLGRLLPDGNIECLGRADNQVKLRGFRVELGEIENVLLSHNFIQQAVVLLNVHSTASMGMDSLNAFIQLNSRSNHCFIREELEKSLKKLLPHYMIPNRIVFLEDVPKTPSGKIDRKALLNIEMKNNCTLPEVIPSLSPALTELQKNLVSIWEDILETRVGIYDNFFSVGGHSVLAVQVARATEQRLVGMHMPVYFIYKYPTVSSLAQKIEEEQHKNNMKIKSTAVSKLIVPINDQGTLPPLFLIHPSLALSCDFLNIRILDKNQPIYGINNPRYGLETDEGFSSIQEMVTLYIDVIKSIRPNGPYRLGGWCFGGTISLEIARSLQAEGHLVEVVILIDTFNIPQRFIQETLSAQDEEAVSISTEQKALKMLKGWEPKSYDGKVVLLKAREIGISADELEGDEDVTIMKSVYNGWETLLTDLRVFSVPGNNDTLLDFPYVVEFERVLYLALQLSTELVDEKGLYGRGHLSVHQRTLLFAVEYEDLYVIQGILNTIDYNGLGLDRDCVCDFSRKLFGILKSKKCKDILNVLDLSQLNYS